MPDIPADAPFRTFSIRVVLVFVIGAVIVAFWLVRDTLLIAFTSVLIAIILRAIARRIVYLTRVSFRWALVLATMAVFALLAGLFYLFGQETAVQLAELGGRIPVAWNDLRQMIADSGYEAQLNEQVGRSLPSGSTILTFAQNVLTGVSGVVAGLVLALMGGIYLAAQPGLYHHGICLLVPTHAMAQTAHALDSTDRALKGWLKGQLLSMLFTGVTITIGLIVINVPAPLALGLVAGLLGFVPMIGPLIAAAFGLLLAITVDFHTVLLTALLYIVVQQIAGNVIEPLIWQHTVKVPPALTLFALLVTGTLFGVVGVLLGGPLLVAGFTLTRELYVKGALGHSLD